MKSISWLVLIAAVFLAGCSSQPKVETDYQAGFNFSALKNFSVAESKRDAKDAVLISPFTLSHIHALLETELSKRYQKVELGDKSDFIVSYHVVVEEKIDPRSYNDLYGFGYYGPIYPYPRPYFHGVNSGLRVYNQGSLIVDIVDAKTDKPIWRGVSEKRLSRGMAPKQQREVLSGAVVEVLAQFPPVN